ncbi:MULTISPECIES: ATP-binding protein [unclassified Microbacterium]|uniref:ATP-binding protein n=1 Tax=unclassified Microbacterium TaxID=2609290 RepID=UPI000CFC4144|nr:MULTISPECIES: ATP-binding protein [unclassified Microbacterium]PQZ54103.1 PAS domain-containing sensor histidine kinase [Microbacterium sp. MYb43]PQZ81584.1 PAS domain-containing sensor histidine kinase [Microbacterium sp. MYb40]PRB17462.1 PAS domain-containing sensor histidine kinase [Microbacterium sp. MYb54]PRB30131.1 PAS domain-containing sensor histidine kinase [Microbacterium sp. MYb50]PRB64175.1 PAS domain-containing sensor histidine kinase [Microbacterium sp. MYb24]
MRATPLDRAETRWYQVFDSPSPLLKQAPTVVATVIAAILTWWVPDLPMTHVVPAVAGIAVVLVATAFAAVLTARGVHDGWAVLLIPIVDIVGLGLFRTGTGGATSLFSSLVLLPVVWLAAAPGIRWVFVVGGLTSIALLMPYFTDPPETSVEWLRGVVGPLVFSAVAAVINQLSRQQRMRVEQAEELVAERTRALSENVAMIVQLRDKERQYRELLDSFESLWSSITAQAVIATDCSGTVTAWNPGAVRLLGLPVDEALKGVRIDRFFSTAVLSMLAADNAEPPQLMPGLPPGYTELSPGIKALFAQADAGATVDGDIDVITTGGTTVPARVTVTPHKDGAGAQQGYLFVLTDETRAVEVARMKDEFVGMISHELRTPLSAIIGFLDLLQNDPGQPLTDDQQEFVGIIERNAQRLLNLVGDLLFTAQVESGRFPLEREEADVAELVRSAARSAGPHAQREGIELIAEVGVDAVPVFVDAGRVGQAIDNLLSNAIKFTPRGGKVTAGVRQVDGGVEFFISDTGVGIPEDEQGMLFTRFFRASTATRNAVPGVGLGLTITRAIVLAHGGTMEVTSQEGVGTEFRFVLPAAPRTEVLMSLSRAD